MDVIEGKIEKLRLGYNWPLVQEKVAKYKRRYLNSSALEWVCQAEQMVYSVITHTDYRYDDCPSQPWIHIPQFPESNLRVVLKSAQSEPPVNSANELAITQSSVWTALLDFCQLSFSTSLQSLNALNLAPPDFKSTFYLSRSALYLMFLTIKGFSSNSAWNLQKLQCVPESIQALQAGVDFLSESEHSKFRSEGIQENVSTALDFWSETLLFTFVMTISGERCANTNMRIAILNQYLKNLFSLIPESLYTLDIRKGRIAFFSLPILKTKSQQRLNELRRCLPEYELLLTRAYPYPSGRNKDVEHLNPRHARVQEVYHFWVRALLPVGRSENETPLDMIGRIYCLLEHLYRGTKHTFQSLPILRYISNAFYVLSCLAPDNLCDSEMIEALASFESYLELWKNVNDKIVDAKLKDEIEAEGVISPSSISREPQKIPEAKRISSLFADSHPPTVPSSEKLEKKAEAPVLKSPALSDKHIVRTRSQIIASFVIPEFGQENVRNVISVMLSAIALILLTFRGELKILQRAQYFGEFAYTIAIQHASDSEDFASILSSIYYHLGIVYHEISMEISDRSESAEFGSKAVTTLQKARALEKSDSKIFYQSALVLAHSGQIDKAMEMINKSIKLDPKFPAAYNLLALILSSKNRFENAIKIATEGWNICLIKLAQEQGLEGDIVEMERKTNWEIIDPAIKSEMISLKITQLALDQKANGSAAALKSIQRVFKSLRKIIGTPFNTIEEATSKFASASEMRGCIGSMDQSKKTGFAKSTVPSAIPKGNSYPNISGLYYRSTYETQISLWLAASSLYRSLGMFEKAFTSISEAQILAETMIRVEVNALSNASKLFSKQGGSSISSASSKLAPSNNSTPYSKQKWGMASRESRRILADVAFEKSLIFYEQYRNKAVAPIEKHQKYKSTVARVEIEKRLEIKHPHAHLFRSKSSLYSFATNPNSSTENQTLETSQTQVRIPVILPTPVAVPELQEMIDFTYKAVLLDVNHLPLQVHLAILYRLKGDLVLAEHWIEKACSCVRRRGSGGSSVGIFGGSSGFWGWYSWKINAEVLQEMGRNSGAKSGIMMSLNMQKLHCLRGFECLPRFY